MFDDPRRQHRSRISKVTLKADARQSESSRINVSSLDRRWKMWKEWTPFCVFGQRSRIVPRANEIPLVNGRDLYDTTTATTKTMTTRDFARKKLGRESLLAKLCASVDNGRCRFLTGSKSTFYIRKSLDFLREHYIFTSRADFVLI